MVEQNPAHLFFSYAHADEAKLLPIHAQMQNVLERNLWIDKVGLDRGIAWENAIKAAIDDSYGVIFAVTKVFVTRRFILEKEIPWVLARFKDKQGAQIFPILFDDVDVPDELKTPFITYQIDARDGDMARVYAELKRELPEAKPGTQPFVVSWPRLTNFKGRDSQLIELHRKLVGDGQVGINTKTKTAGLHGMGGIGKTQLAVEYAHRYRYHYPGGVYWLNAGADWQKEVAACAVNLDRSLVDKKDEEKALAFRDWLKDQSQEALVVLDNVDDPAEITRREIAPKLTLYDLRGQTKARLLLTSRVQTMPTGFESVSVNVLDKLDARAVLLEAWVDSQRKDKADVETLDKITYLLGYLPLALGWIEAALRQLPDITPTELLEELKARGLDDLIQELQRGDIDIGTPAYHDRLVGSVLDWQIKQLKSADAPTLLALTAAFGEAAVVPLERLRLMIGLPEKGLIKPFAKAVKDVQAYSLVETLNEGTAFRLHPLTQVYVSQYFNATERIREAVPRLVAAYRDPLILDSQTRTRGFATVVEDLRVTQSIFMSDELDALTRLLTLEEPHLLVLPEGMQQGYVIQQVRERAYYEGDYDLKATCEKWLIGKCYLHHTGLRYPASKALLRVLPSHNKKIRGVLETHDGRFLSWADDNTLRLWTKDGELLTVSEGHRRRIIGALETHDGRFLSWADDNTLRLWTKDGELLTVSEGHRRRIIGALETHDGRFLSWAVDNTLRLWTKDGELLTVMEGHRGRVIGALETHDGRFLSWDDDTLLLWTNEGDPLTVMESHSSGLREVEGIRRVEGIRGALETRDGRFLSWDYDTLLLWTNEGRPLAIIEGHDRRITGAFETYDGCFLSWGDDNIRLWTKEGEPLRESDHRRVKGALETRDGRFLFWTYYNIQLWTKEGETLVIMNGHGSELRGVLETHDGYFLSWADDNTLRLSTEEGELLAMMEGHTRVRGALETLDGRFLSWGDDNMRLWDYHSAHISQVGESLILLEGHRGRVNGVLETRDGRFLSWDYDNILRLWSNEGEPLALMEGHRRAFRGIGGIRGALETHDGRFLSWAHDTIRLWTKEGEPLSVIGDRLRGIGGIRGVLETRDGFFLSWALDHVLRLWTKEGELLAVIGMHSRRITGVLETRDGFFLSWGDDNIQLWTKEGKPLALMEGHNRGVRKVLETHDGFFLSWGDDNIQLWTKEGELVALMEGHSSEVKGVLETHDGRFLSWGYDDTLRLWTKEGKPLAMMEAHMSISGALETRDGRFLSWSGNNSLQLWTKEGENLVLLEGHSNSVNGALETRDGYFLSWADDSMLRLWSNKGAALATYSSDAPISCCIEAKDGRIVVGDQGGRVLFLTLVEGE